ncbi:hypothetical protein FNF29_00974 [Cafeteria roenbergensis]|uniref:Uncharacterized protein n=2 Tax=Cafeteria roenbergensis TaxID=33653 RepID=A0A5A8DQ38_CAFRO|nr:hypothetical protein FNF29_00974 [Cafeteria roenbergensis]KAA0167543.1 hypothetical protein FNF28_02757 [Cafeteria roenbergensis]|eukprot:KAA0156865.1 hypothetical protein FNF29_00974 [Cafeteria roenbergensis]
MAHTHIASRLFHDVVGMFTPVLTSSRFVDEGVLTPEEFVAAGDALIRVSPLWQWEAGEPESRQPFFPADKQYLLLKGVPCSQRVSSLESSFRKGGVCESTDEDGWLRADTGEPEAAASILVSGGEAAGGGLSSFVRDDYEPIQSLEEIPSHTSADDEAGAAAEVGATAGGRAQGDVGGDAAAAGDDAEDDDEYVDLDGFGGEEADEGTLGAAASAGSHGAGSAGGTHPSAAASRARAFEDDEAFERRRTYDVSLVYDKAYRTPRVFLMGHGEDGTPLLPEQVMEDVVTDYANKTVTAEAHFHLPSAPVQASIHPCRHAAAMTRIVASLLEAGATREEVAGRVELYLLYFLKFIQSVVPTIEYDSTGEVAVRGAE